MSTVTVTVSRTIAPAGSCNAPGALYATEERDEPEPTCNHPSPWPWAWERDRPSVNSTTGGFPEEGYQCRACGAQMPPRERQRWPGPGKSPDAYGAAPGAVNVIVDVHPAIIEQSCDMVRATACVIDRAREIVGPGPGLKLWWAGWVPEDGRDVVRVPLMPGDADLDPIQEDQDGPEPEPQPQDGPKRRRHRGKKRRQ